MSITLSKLLDLREYHNVMLLHTYSQIQTIVDPGDTEYPDIVMETLTIRIDNDGKIANTPIYGNRSKIGSAYEDSDLD
jgi:hypothetical protein